MSIFSKLFGTYSERELKRNKNLVDKVLSLEGDMKKLSDSELKAKTLEFKDRLNSGQTLDDILPEAFAVVREASYRVLGMKHFKVQVEGGVILHQGKISEMRTGEGKTLVATLPAYLNALTGKGVHIVTVNDYLAKRDREWMGKVYEFLGLTVGCILHDLSNEDRREAYNADITYGTNNEFGFDYLRDNMVIYLEEMVQRPLNYAIVDEVDSILIDEARTPLIISGRGDKSTKLYELADMFVKTLSHRIKDPKEEVDPLEQIFNKEVEEETVDYVIDEKQKSCAITEKGTAKAEAFFRLENLSDPENMEIAHHIQIAMKANSLMKKDIDYVNKDGEILIVDEFTGRLMYGRRYSDGLHQAIEAKEKVEVRSESKTLATITFQNYFRMYKKLAGMTGTAMTEADEFREIYKMDTIEIPTNKPVIRDDRHDIVYKNENGKFKAVIEEIKEHHAKGQPVLVGTISIEKSEILSKMLKKERIAHEVLNAKQHEREAEIVSQAGRLGAVTIATNMAGRGTDIVLGGNPEAMAKNDLKKKGYDDEVITYVDGFYVTDDEEILEARKLYQELHAEYKKETDENGEKVVAVGGLAIIGTERHESRRIDNQLRGRAGRQGDPGESVFYLSLEDDLMRLFGGDRVSSIIETMNFPEDEPLQHGLLTKTIESAQMKVEGNNFATRKHVLKYDDVMNQQRNTIYGERRKVLEGMDLSPQIKGMIRELIESAIEIRSGGAEYPEEWDIAGIDEYLKDIFNVGNSIMKQLDYKTMTKDQVEDKLEEIADALYENKVKEFGEEKFREVERIIMLQVVDSKWMDHIDAMDQLRQGIGLRAMGQRDPVIAYQNEGFDMFEEMNYSIREDTVKLLYRVQNPEKLQRTRVAKEYFTNDGEDGPVKQKTYVRKEKKVGRNDPCPCGSGKKYKNCCGRN
ncbi:MAG: preprotein translocase subunit SecA [Tissierellia bacterium]|nr:preprotein translocase subunit SecA [Tissierellia bacterium]